jgi:endonuclease V-like protein UPF0215 family
VAISKADKANEYVRYAEHCLKMAGIAPDRASRVIQREMAAEWIKLAHQAATEDAAQGAPATREAKRRTVAS